MKLKSMTLAVMSLLLVVAMVGPASANKMKDKDGVAGGVKDAGLVQGNATVGKLSTPCTNEGTATVSGPGIGIPGVNGVKNAYYQFNTTVTSAFKAVLGGAQGTLNVCGRLDKMFSNVGGGVGAACGSSKGWDGKGAIDYPGSKPTTYLRNVGWKASVTTFIVTGDVVQASSGSEAKTKAPQDILLAEIQATGLAGCLTKAGSGSGKTGGGTNFVVNGSYQIVNGTRPSDNLPVGTCKRNGDATCLYGNKKPGASG